MDIIVKAYVFNDIDDIEEFNISVNETKYPLVKKALEREFNKIVKYLYQLKDTGVIKSVFIPKNKKLQKELDSLTTYKRQIKYSISKLKAVFG